MAFLGMDVDLAKTEHGKLTTEINNLRSAKENLTSMVQRTVPEVWKGPDATSFEQSWNQYKSTLDTLLHNMEDFAKEFMADITEQEATSRN